MCTRESASSSQMHMSSEAKCNYRLGASIVSQTLIRITREITEDGHVGVDSEDS